MIPQKLVISGFLSYRDETEIDFTGLHVACISGPNGAGKSAMLDAMTWALFGIARKSDESIINTAGSGTAEVDFDFLYEGECYRILRKRSHSKSSVEFLVRSPETDSWKPLTDKTVSLTNKRIIDTLHMNYDTFVNASFFLQGKADRFTGQKPTERKEILGSILNLDIWEDYRQKAAEKRKEAEFERKSLASDLQDHEDELAREPEMRKQAEDAEQLLRTAENEYQAAEDAYNRAVMADSERKGQEKLVREYQSRINDLDNRIRKIRSDIESQQNKMEDLKKTLDREAEILSEYTLLQEARRKVTELTDKSRSYHLAVSQKQAIENEIGRQKTILETNIRNLENTESALQKDLQQLPELRQRLQTLNSEISELKKTADTENEHANKRDDLAADYRELAGKHKLLEQQIADLEAKQRNILEMKGAPCPHCGQQMDAERTREHLADLQRQANELKEQQKKLGARLSDIKNRGQQETKLLQAAQTAAQNRLQKELAAAPLQAAIRQLEQREEDWKNNGSGTLNKYRDTLARESYCLTERESLEKVRAQIEQLQYSENDFTCWKEQVQKVQSAEQLYLELKTAKGQSDILISGLEQNRKDLESLLADSGNANETFTEADRKLRQMKLDAPDLESANQVKNDAELKKNQINTQKINADAALTNLDNVRSRAETEQRELKEKDRLIARLQTLEKTFGKNGIPAMIIEQAIPEIEDRTNSILSQLTNGRMSVRIETQKDYKSGSREDKKETLDIIISDEFGTRPYELFSGGEAFRINFALRLALSHLLVQRAGSRLQTLVIDEGFGSQDNEGRTKLIDAITTVQDDFEKILVITHLSELKDAFPSRIEVEKGPEGSRVEVFA